MKKGIVFTLLIIFGLFFVAKTSFAFSFSLKMFGGEITDTRATEIENLEDEGWSCNVPGTSITIKSITGPTTYLIPDGEEAKSGGDEREDGQRILGLYDGQEKTTITCTRPCGVSLCTTTVDLNTIKLFGTSTIL